MGPKTDEERVAVVRVLVVVVRAEWELGWPVSWFYVRLLGCVWTPASEKVDSDAACMLARAGADAWRHKLACSQAVNIVAQSIRR